MWLTSPIVEAAPEEPTPAGFQRGPIDKGLEAEDLKDREATLPTSPVVADQPRFICSVYAVHTDAFWKSKAVFFAKTPKSDIWLRGFISGHIQRRMPPVVTDERVFVNTMNWNLEGPDSLEPLFLQQLEQACQASVHCFTSPYLIDADSNCVAFLVMEPMVWQANFDRIVDGGLNGFTMEDLQTWPTFLRNSSELDVAEPPPPRRRPPPPPLLDVSLVLEQGLEAWTGLGSRVDFWLRERHPAAAKAAASSEYDSV